MPRSAAALPRLTTLRAPTLVVVGDRDAPDIRAIADTLLLRLPNARRVVFPGAGHFPSLEQSARFTRELLAFPAAPWWCRMRVGRWLTGRCG